MGSSSFRWLFLSLTCLGLAADQASKYAVFRWLYGEGVWADGLGNSYDLVPGWFQFIAQFDPTEPFATDWREPLQRWNAPVMPRVNHGALFGMGQSHRERANLIFLAISGAAALVILVWGCQRSVASDRWLSAALGLILAGTLGNFYDRLVFGGVRDFLYFYKINWPVFNVADCCLVCGATLLFFHAFFWSSPEKGESPGETSAAPPPRTRGVLPAASSDSVAVSGAGPQSNSTSVSPAASSLQDTSTPPVVTRPDGDPSRP
jgi:lipoprotein signal peptidase